MRKIFGFDFLAIEDPEELKKKIIEKELFSYEDLEEYKSLSQIIDFVYKKKIRVNIIQPTILYNYPAVLIPLARRNDEDNRIIDVFQIVACGTELCKAYSELVNPEIQRQNFEEQATENLGTALANLDERSQEIIKARWLDDEKATLHDLAAKYNVSAERIRQLEANALKKLKSAVDF